MSKIETRRVLLASLKTPVGANGSFSLLTPTAMSGLLSSPRKQLCSEYGHPRPLAKCEQFIHNASALANESDDTIITLERYTHRAMIIDLARCCCILSAFEYDAQTFWLSAMATPAGPMAELVREDLRNYQEGQRLFSLRGFGRSEELKNYGELTHVQEIVTWDFLGLHQLAPLADFTVEQDFKHPWELGSNFDTRLTAAQPM